MKAKVVAKIIVFVMTFLLCQGAGADVVTFKHVNGWEAWGGKVNDGRKICGISTEGGGRWLGIKYFEGNKYMTIHLSKNTWIAKRGERINIIMTFDDESPWKAYGTAFFLENGNVAFEINIDLSQLKQWFIEFRRSNTLYIRFPNDNIDDWKADLSGTPEISDAMGACLNLM